MGAALAPLTHFAGFIATFVIITFFDGVGPWLDLWPAEIVVNAFVSGLWPLYWLFIAHADAQPEGATTVMVFASGAQLALIVWMIVENALIRRRR